MTFDVGSFDYTKYGNNPGRNVFGNADINAAKNQGASNYQIRQLMQRANQEGTGVAGKAENWVQSNAPRPEWNYGGTGHWGFGIKDVNAINDLDTVKRHRDWAQQNGLNIGPGVNEWITKQQGGPAPSNSGSGSLGSYTHPMSSDFIGATNDPQLGYETYNNPGNNQYISNFQPKQYNYMNDSSALTVDELTYKKGNEKGLIDREGTAEQAGALLKDYIFNINEEVNKNNSETKVGTIGKVSDDESDEQYRRRYKESPYDEYDPSKYY